MYFATLYKSRRYIQRRPVAEVRNNKNKDKSETGNKSKNNNK